MALNASRFVELHTPRDKENIKPQILIKLIAVEPFYKGYRKKWTYIENVLIPEVESYTDIKYRISISDRYKSSKYRISTEVPLYENSHLL